MDFGEAIPRYMSGTRSATTQEEGAGGIRKSPPNAASVTPRERSTTFLTQHSMQGLEHDRLAVSRSSNSKTNAPVATCRHRDPYVTVPTK